MAPNPKIQGKPVAAVAGSDGAPVIFADIAYAWGNNLGIVQVELGVNTLVPLEGSNKVKIRPLCSGHLRLSPVAAAQLRDMLDKTLEQFENEARLQRAAQLATAPPASPARNN
jgi:hypothetical protein